MIVAVEGSPGDHRCRRRGPLPGRGRPRLRRLPALDQPPARSLPRRGRGAFQPRSRRPRRSPTATDPAVVERILALRTTLTGRGLDAGPHTIGWHLAQDGITVSTASISRILT